jgi:uncharacterized protein YggU (UPF0235/DUF167 family)
MPGADGAGGGARRGARTTAASGHDAPGDARLTVDVHPRAGTSGLEVRPDGVLRARVAAAPVDGAANQALRSLLADALGCPRSAIEIVQGKRARRKVVRLRGLSADAVRRRLASRAPLPPVARGVQGGSVVCSPPCGSMRGGRGVAGGPN